MTPLLGELLHSNTKYRDKGRSLVTGFPSRINLQEQPNLARIYSFTGRAQEKNGDFSSALESYRQAASLLADMAMAPNASAVTRWRLVKQYVAMGNMLAELGRTDEGVANARKGCR